MRRLPAWFDLIYNLAGAPAGVTLYASGEGDTLRWWLNPEARALAGYLARAGLEVHPTAAPDPASLRYVNGDAACGAARSGRRAPNLPLRHRLLLRLLRQADPVNRGLSLRWLRLLQGPSAVQASLVRLRWGAGGRHCPHCGSTEVVEQGQGKGQHRCNSCRRCFDVLSATVIGCSERSERYWLLAWHLYGCGWPTTAISAQLRIPEDELSHMLGPMLRGRLERNRPASRPSPAVMVGQVGLAS